MKIFCRDGFSQLRESLVFHTSHSGSSGIGVRFTWWRWVFL
jgi:hypothetical protein